MTLPCICCGRALESIVPSEDDSNYNQPAGGTTFVSYGQYGSTIFDPIGDRLGAEIYLEVNFCDNCLKHRAEHGMINVNCSIKRTDIHQIQTWMPGKPPFWPDATG